MADTLDLDARIEHAARAYADAREVEDICRSAVNRAKQLRMLDGDLESSVTTCRRDWARACTTLEIAAQVLRTLVAERERRGLAEDEVVNDE